MLEKRVSSSLSWLPYANEDLLQLDEILHGIAVDTGLDDNLALGGVTHLAPCRGLIIPGGTKILSVIYVGPPPVVLLLPIISTVA